MQAPSTSADWERYPKIVPSDRLSCQIAPSAEFSLVATADGPRRCHFCKRSGIIQDKEDFFSFRSRGLARPLEQAALRLLSKLSDKRDRPRSVTIFGELFGGHYPHPDVQTVPGIQHPVQRGVWYTKDLVFCAFDVAVGEPGEAQRRFLDFDVARAAAKEAGFCFVEPLARGSLAKCLDYDYRFNSTLPAILGLPDLGVANLAEGVVVRAVREAAPNAKGARAMFKLKIAEFRESAPKYAHDEWRAAKTGGGGDQAKAAAASATLSAAGAVELVLYEIRAALTEQRVATAVSKLGRVEQVGNKKAQKAAFRRLLDELKRDVLEEAAEAVHGQRAAEEVVRRLAAGERAPAEGDAEVEEDALAVEFKDEAAKLVGRYLKAEAGQGAGPTGYA